MIMSAFAEQRESDCPPTHLSIKFASQMKWIELCCLFVWCGFFGQLAIQVANAALREIDHDGENQNVEFVLCASLLTCLMTYLLVDFTSGVIHCFADHFGSIDTPIFGAKLIGPFREHHKDPEAICRESFLWSTATVSMFLLPCFPSYWLLRIFFPSSFVAYLADLSLLVFLFFMLLTNQFHRWAHSQTTPTLIRCLQRSRLVVSPASHQAHHRSPHNSNFCITNGWCNPFLEAIGFWPWLLSFSASPYLSSTEVWGFQHRTKPKAKKNNIN